ncbi:hypothetical protein U9M48_004434 [Paspalum notatum var. saurae]|uniref:Uncharacterized protein n=1 Tax=Paspalum notatum var. saurae TaxID=547442 RepID=A0AAQ3PTA1_PASNO
MFFLRRPQTVPRLPSISAAALVLSSAGSVLRCGGSLVPNSRRRLLILPEFPPSLAWKLRMLFTCHQQRTRETLTREGGTN